jgi:hypothetical protein
LQDRRTRLTGWEDSYDNPAKREAAVRALTSDLLARLTERLRDAGSFREFVQALKDQDRQRKLQELERQIEEFVREDRKLQYDEGQAVYTNARNKGISAKEAEKLIVEVCARYGAEIEKAPPWPPIRQLRTQPTSLEELPQSLLDDWEGARSLFSRRFLSELLVDRGAPQDALESARRGEANYERFDRLYKDTAIWIFAWEVGFRQLSLTSGGKTIQVDSIEALLRACDGDGTILGPALLDGRLDGWLAAAIRDASLAKEAAAGRDRARAGVKRDALARDEGLKLLWKAGELRLMALNQAKTTEQLAACVPDADFRVRLRDLLDRGLIEAWLASALKQAELAQQIGSARREWEGNGELPVWASWYLLGGRTLFLSNGRSVVATEQLRDLEPSDQEPLAEAIRNETVVVWLRYAWGSTAGDWLKNIAVEHGAARGVQELFWRFGIAPLRLAVRGKYVNVTDPSELPPLYAGDGFDAVQAAYKDTRIADWLKGFHAVHPARAIPVSDLPETHKLFAILWKSGWRDLPLESSQQGPASLEDLIRMVDRADSAGNGAALRGKLVATLKEGLLERWLTTAQGNQALADALGSARKELEKSPEASEDLLVLLGAKQPALVAEKTTYDLAGLQEGDTSQQVLSLRAHGSRGYLYGTVQCDGDVLGLGASGTDTSVPFRLKSGEQLNIPFMVRPRLGRHYAAERFDIRIASSNRKDPRQSVAAVVSTVFPWKVIIRYSIAGTLAAIPAFMLVRAWIAAMVNRGDWLDRVEWAKFGFGQMLAVGIAPAAIALGSWAWFRSTKPPTPQAAEPGKP